MASEDDDLLAGRGVPKMRAVLSKDAVTMRDPSGLNAAECTLSSWPLRTTISLPVAASQMRAVLSGDAVTMRDPSGLNAADFTSSSWPLRTTISLPVAASQMRRSCQATP